MALNSGTDQLWIAAKDGDLARAKKLLSEGAMISEIDWIGNTPLHWAARGGHLSVVDMLLSEGADVNSFYSTATNVGRRSGKTYHSIFIIFIILIWRC